MKNIDFAYQSRGFARADALAACSYLAERGLTPPSQGACLDALADPEAAIIRGNHQVMEFLLAMAYVLDKQAHRVLGKYEDGWSIRHGRLYCLASCLHIGKDIRLGRNAYRVYKFSADAVVDPRHQMVCEKLADAFTRVASGAEKTYWKEAQDKSRDPGPDKRVVANR